MTDFPLRGTSDTRMRWWGVSPWKAGTLVVAGVLLIAGWSLPSGRWLWWLLAVTLLVLALWPVAATTPGVVLGRELGRRFRPRLLRVRRGPPTWRFEHRGDARLAGLDAVVARDITTLLTARDGAHRCLVVRASSSPSTVTITGPATTPSAQWVRVSTPPEPLVLECATHLRTTRGVTRVLRVASWGAHPSPLRAFHDRAPQCGVALVFDVLDASRSRRRSEQRLHRLRVDDTFARSWGFRPRAITAYAVKRATEQEAWVARGNALASLAAFVIVEAPHRRALRQRVAVAERCAVACGLRTDRGRGRQGVWWRAVQGWPQ